MYKYIFKIKITVLLTKAMFNLVESIVSIKAGNYSRSRKLDNTIDVRGLFSINIKIYYIMITTTIVSQLSCPNETTNSIDVCGEYVI